MDEQPSQDAVPPSEANRERRRDKKRSTSMVVDGMGYRNVMNDVHDPAKAAKRGVRKGKLP